MSVQSYQPTASKQRRKRGVILSSQGLQKLEKAKIEAEYRENGGNRFTLENLSERTGLAMDTLMKVFACEGNVDKKTLKSCFMAFGLTLEAGDYYQPQLAVRDEIPELPRGQVPLNSRFYVERSPVESQCYQAIQQPGNLIGIKSEPGMGKTSLMRRLLDHARGMGYATVDLSLQLADRHLFAAPSKFFQWLCANISLGLQLHNRVKDYWDDILGDKVSCKLYFEQYLLAQNDLNLVIAIDEIDLLFNYPELAEDFFALLRIFYEEAKNNAVWQKLRCVILYSLDFSSTLATYRSDLPFGLSVELPGLTCEQVTYLAHQYQLNWSYQESSILLELVGGNPSLVRLALYNIYSQNTTLEQIISDTVIAQNYFYQKYLHPYGGYIQTEKLEFNSKVLNIKDAKELGKKSRLIG